MISFLDKLKQTLNHELNTSVTENGALGYRTTGKDLVDLNFAVASLRRASESDIITRFSKAYFEDRKAAVKWLFYVRDVRGGLGERRLFRIIFKYLAENHQELPIRELMELIPEYGRFDDLLILLGTEHSDAVIACIKTQLEQDVAAAVTDAPISLLAKWLPSVNTSSKASRESGKYIAKQLGMTEKHYRQTLSALRAHLDVPERKLSAKQYQDIIYEAVPSKANLLYRNAFLRHDEERRKAYLESLKRGETSIHAGVLHPHEIVHSYMDDVIIHSCKAGFQLKAYDETLEQLWKALKDITVSENSLVVADGSGSMMVPIGGGSCSALSVANALAIYFAERSKGAFKNQYITFSMRPQLVDLSKGESLREKIQIALTHNEVANTDIHAVFKLILATAVNHHMKQDEMPQNLIIVSDMEFDRCAEGRNQTLFEHIGKEFKQSGYQLPRLVFWNVNSRTGTIPVRENELGVALVSGFSTNIFDMVLSGALDPYQCLLDILGKERYDMIETVMNHSYTHER